MMLERNYMWFDDEKEEDEFEFFEDAFARVEAASKLFYN